MQHIGYENGEDALCTRKSVIHRGAVLCAAALLPETVISAQGGPAGEFRTRTPRRGLVLWYSQTGHTARIGAIIAHRWRLLGLEVDATDYRAFDRTLIGSYDLIALGTPVFYMYIPDNLREWLLSIPDIRGAAAASYATFGGSGNNQHNTACAVLDLLSEKGGIPAGTATFGNMSTFAPTWSMGNGERTLRYRHLPNEGTYENARNFAASVVNSVRDGRAVPARGNFDSGIFFRHLPQVWSTRLMITSHGINRDRCLRCGLCSSVCPAGAIDVERGTVSGSRCIACMGCVNNCPAGAVEMSFLGRRVTGFNEFLRMNSIEIREPAELRV